MFVYLYVFFPGKGGSFQASEILVITSGHQKSCKTNQLMRDFG